MQRTFAILWLIFFALLAALTHYKPSALLGASTVLGVAWLVGWLFSGLPRLRGLPGVLFPVGFYLLGSAGSSSLTLGILAGIGVVGAAIAALPGPGVWLSQAWMDAGMPIGWTISHVILSIVYYLVLTPTGLLLRLLGRDPLKKSPEQGAASYWIERRQRDRASYFRPF